MPCRPHGYWLVRYVFRAINLSHLNAITKTIFYIAWRTEDNGAGLKWWIEKMKEEGLAHLYYFEPILVHQF